MDQRLGGLAQLTKYFPPTVLQNESIYFVGGCVRDAKLGKQIHDIDLLVMDKPREAAKATARFLDCPFYALDEERDIWRVLYSDGSDKTFIDFSAPRASDLADDLRLRDFTINAMAVPLAAPEKLIDPLNGSTDLAKKILRQCSSTAFHDDPLRCLRALRFAVSFQLLIEPKTREALKAEAVHLGKVSSERIRDEFVALTSARKVSGAMRLADALGILHHLFPELDGLRTSPHNDERVGTIWTHTLSVVEGMELIWDVLYQSSAVPNVDSFVQVQTKAILRKHIPDLQNLYDQEVTPGRKKISLLYWAALFHDVGKAVIQPTTLEDFSIAYPQHEIIGAEIFETIGKKLKLSSDEISRITMMVRNHMLLHQLAKGLGDLSPLGLYRLFREFGVTLLDICFVGLADTLGKFLLNPPLPKWQSELETCDLILNTWFKEQTAIVDPPKLVDGNEIMEWLGLEAGPEVGRKLEQIREAQVQGKVMTRDEAYAFVRRNQMS